MRMTVIDVEINGFIIKVNFNQWLCIDTEIGISPLCEIEIFAITFTQA